VALPRRDRVFAAVERRPAAVAAGVWALWALAVLTVVIVGAETDAFADPQHWNRHGGPLWPLFTWDYGWYLFIAQSGYPRDVLSPVYAFFPLWPLIMRASGAMADWIVAFAVVIVASGLAFLGIAVGSPSRRGWRAALVLACWPGSFMLLLGYPDALALAAAAWAAALALRGRPWLAGVLAAVGAAARPTGVLIAIPLALVTRSGIPGRVFAAGAPIVAAAAVQIFFWERSGDPRAFFHAQALPIWERNGPSRLTKWPGHIADAFQAHAALIVIGAIVAVVLIVVLARMFNPWYGAVIGYAFVVGALLFAAQSPVSRIQSGIAAVVFPVVVVLWRLGARYRPWALFATAVVAVSFFSGSVTSFGRQALFAFPLYWALADGPKQFRHPLVAVAAIAANVAYLLTITKYAP
jgi:hypothetical protein